MSSALRSPWPALLLIALAAGCNCGTAPEEACRSVPGNRPDHPGVCDSNAACGEPYACEDVGGGLSCCIVQERTCASEADCCPGQACPADAKSCFDRFLACDSDKDCGDKGDRFCEAWTDAHGTTKRCRLKSCDAQGACPEGLACFNGECIADLPCGGFCESGTACIPSASLDRCQALDCPTACAPGFIASVGDAQNVWGTCTLAAVTCDCKELPPLRSSDLGRFSAIAAAPDKTLWVSAYDGEYGDLVVQSHGLDGTLRTQEYVDGLPGEGAPIRWAPSGPRGGVVEAGPDVGRHTDVVVGADGAVYVSYQDVRAGDLKLARRAPNGTWSHFTLDGAKADLGHGSAVAIDGQGRLGVAYFQRGGNADFDVATCPGTRPTGNPAYVTALKYARSKNASPASAADFDILTLACQARPPPPCLDCGSGSVCADSGSGAACHATTTGCSACDPNGESCVDVGGSPRCAPRTTVKPLQEIVDGVGLYPSLAFLGDDAYVAYMRRTGGDGDLYGMRVRGSLAVGAPVLLDGSGDTGFFASIQADPARNRLGIAYHDFSSRQLRFYLADSLTTGVTPEIVDRGGSGDGDWSYVGTDASVVFLPDGGVLAVYQDATKGDLKLARRSGSWSVLPPLREKDAVGFFADGVLVDGILFASHARIGAQLYGGGTRLRNTLLLERLPVP